MSPHEEIAELLGVYALHALDPDEAERVEAHLVTCATCREELDQHYDVAASIGDAALVEDSFGGDGGFGSGITVPDELVARIVSSVRSSGTATTGTATTGTATSGTATTSTATVAPAPTLPAEPATPAAPAANVTDLDAARAARGARRGLGRRGRLGAAAAAVALVGAATVPSLVRSTPAPTLAAMAARAEKQPGTHIAVLRDTKGTTVGTVLVTASGAGYVRNEGLSALAADRTYQLWAVTKEDATHKAVAISAGVLGRAPGVVAFTAAAPADTFAAYAVSVEPVMGSITASSAPIAVGTLV